jgi:hypothetical protein
MSRAEFSPIATEEKFVGVLDTKIRVCGTQTTRARLIWFFNLICFAAHTAWVVVVVLTCRGKGDAMEIRIYRPMALYNTSATDGGGYEMSLVDNGMPIRIDILTILFFALSALAHFCVVAIAPFPASEYLYWRQIDRCFMWWRWLEYSMSSPIMLVGIALVCGIRDQSTLAAVCVLQWITIALGLFTELVSTPHDDMQSWIGDESKVGRNPRITRQINYVRRMTPHVLGFFPYLSAWALILYGFLQALDDIRERDKALFDRMPAFVYAIVFGSFALFSLFTIPQIRYQWLAPKYYYYTEYWYCTLSLTSKSFLGALLYANVLRKASVSEAL